MEKASRRSRIRLFFWSRLPAARPLAAILVGTLITALTTFALVRHVQHKIATAKVSSNPAKWMQAARTEAYDACYYGCNGCKDPAYAFKACEMTARGNVTGVICDGRLMWNWVERYPIECLKAVGEFYKAAALRSLKKSYRNRLAIIILTVLAGVTGAVVTSMIWAKCFPARPRTRPLYATTYIGSGLHEIDAGWGTSPSCSPKRRGCRGRGSRGSAGRFALAVTAFAAILGRSRAYPCTGYDPIDSQYFINANKTLYGVVHGWLSNCYDYTCGCTTSCSSSSSGSSSCSTSCSTCTDSNFSPAQCVNATLQQVWACGFKPVDAVQGDVNVRIANPIIEKAWWTKISVNKLNLTDVTDDSIWCLHDFVNKF